MLGFRWGARSGITRQFNAAAVGDGGAGKCGGAAAAAVVASAAEALARDPVEDLSPARHLALLAFLCDEALDTLLLHNVLQSAAPPPRP